MEITEILDAFDRLTDEFPLAAAEAAIARREEITPELLRILEDLVDHAEERAAEGDYMAHTYAMFLLAEFRETRAYSLMIRFLSLPGDTLHPLCEDFIGGDLAQLLAAVCGGDLAGIQSLIEDEEAYEWARSAALRSLVVLVAAGEKSRDEVMSYFTSLYRGKLERESSIVWSELVELSSALYPTEVMADMRLAYHEGLVETNFVSLRNVEHGLRRTKERVLAELADSPFLLPIKDTVAALQSLRDPEDDDEFPEDGDLEDYDPEPWDGDEELEPSLPIRREAPKVGRNDPCPCGSGKKYKKCHGANA